jgi:hypothetical protein
MVIPIVSGGERPERRQARLGLTRSLVALYTAFAVEHAYGAFVYGTPVRLVGIPPLGLLLAAALWLFARHARTGGRLALSVGAIIVAVAFIGLAGVLEGGFNHALKVAFHVAGTADDRLRELFGGLNFAVPDDAAFEGVGMATLALAIPVTVRLLRLLRLSGSRRRSAPVTIAGAITTAAAVALFADYLTRPYGHAGLVTLAILGTALGLGLIAVASIDGQAERTSHIVVKNGTMVPVTLRGATVRLSFALKAVALLDIVVLGAVWLVAPTTGLGDHPDARSLLVARALGTDLVVIGIMNWIISRREAASARPFLLPNILMHMVPATIIIVLIVDGAFGAADWLGAGLHLAPAALLTWCLIASVPRGSARPKLDTRSARSA